MLVKICAGKIKDPSGVKEKISKDQNLLVKKLMKNDKNKQQADPAICIKKNSKKKL